jgi:hypothetical protein
VYLLDQKPIVAIRFKVNHDNYSNRLWRCFNQISALSDVDGSVVVYHVVNG